MKEYVYRPHGLPYWPDEYKFLWLDADRGLWEFRGDLLSLDEHVFPLVKNKRVAVQAGGAMGMWPKRMAQVFDVVYTFEPNKKVFNCCVYNCWEDNIVLFNAALADCHYMVGMESPPEYIREDVPYTNLGAYRVKDLGHVPTLRIDDLGLPHCDLLMLDIEGYELFALKGAIETIKKYHPVIVLEDKGCSEHYGYSKGYVETYLHKAGYKTHSRFHGERDVILT